MDKATLLAPRAGTPSGMPEETVEVSGLGEVRVRALSRLEATVLERIKGAEAIERKAISMAMVDPVMTESEVGDWQKVCIANETMLVAERIAKLSGLAEGAEKAAYKSDGEQPSA